jgi:hypothetical protein
MLSCGKFLLICPQPTVQPGLIHRVPYATRRVDCVRKQWPVMF